MLDQAAVRINNLQCPSSSPQQEKKNNLLSQRQTNMSTLIIARETSARVFWLLHYDKELRGSRAWLSKPGPPPKPKVSQLPAHSLVLKSQQSCRCIPIITVKWCCLMCIMLKCKLQWVLDLRPSGSTCKETSLIKVVHDPSIAWTITGLFFFLRKIDGEVDSHD